MSPHTLSAAQTPADAAARASSSEDLCSKGGVPVGIGSEPMAAPKAVAETMAETMAEKMAGTAAAATTTVAMPCMNPGKAIPGPDEWRALERRASSFRA
jgi:hypothetical protein